MTKKEPTVERHVMASNETFEVPVPVDEASVLGFTFEVEDDATVEFSVAFKASGRKKTTQLLAPATYGRNAGEVLLPSAGECIVRWHNPAGWLWSSSAALQYSLTAARAGAAPYRGAKAAAAPAAAPKLKKGGGSSAPPPGMPPAAAAPAPAKAPAAAPAAAKAPAPAPAPAPAKAPAPAPAPPPAAKSQPPVVEPPKRVVVLKETKLIVDPRGAVERSVAFAAGASSLEVTFNTNDGADLRLTGSGLPDFVPERSAGGKFTVALPPSATRATLRWEHVSVGWFYDSPTHFTASATVMQPAERIRSPLVPPAPDPEYDNAMAAAVGDALARAMQMRSKVSRGELAALAARVGAEAAAAAHFCARRRAARRRARAGAATARRTHRIATRGAAARRGLAVAGAIKASATTGAGTAATAGAGACGAKDLAHARRRGVCGGGRGARRVLRRRRPAAPAPAPSPKPPPPTPKPTPPPKRRTEPPTPSSSVASSMAKAPTPLLSPASAAAAAARVAALPSSSPELLESLGLSKYAARFVAEDLTETAMLLAIIELPDGKADLRAVLSDLGMSVGHREKLLLALLGGGA